MHKTLKALGVALLGYRGGVRFNKKRGTAFFRNLGPHVARFAALFYDVRYRKSGTIFFQLRDRKRERKILKKIIQH